MLVTDGAPGRVAPGLGEFAQGQLVGHHALAFSLGPSQAMLGGPGDVLADSQRRGNIRLEEAFADAPSDARCLQLSG